MVVNPSLAVDVLRNIVLQIRHSGPQQLFVAPAIKLSNCKFRGAVPVVLYVSGNCVTPARLQQLSLIQDVAAVARKKIIL